MPASPSPATTIKVKFMIGEDIFAYAGREDEQECCILNVDRSLDALYVGFPDGSARWVYEKDCSRVSCKEPR